MHIRLIKLGRAIRNVKAWRVLSRQPIPPSYRPDLQAQAVASTSTLLPAPTSSTPPPPPTPKETSNPIPLVDGKHPIGAAHLVYTPMIHARLLVEREVVQGKTDEEAFNRKDGMSFFIRLLRHPRPGFWAGT